MRRAARALPLLALAAVLAGPARAGSLRATVAGEDEKPLADAVVSATLLAGGEPAPVPPRGDASIDQVDKEFVPHVSALRAGTSVRFPNRDQIRHHVYSFSPAKSFEIPLYKGVPAEPVVFERPGIVVLGCNIHDWMRGYVVVLETPWFAITSAEGAVALEGLPAGEYRVEAWHPTLRGEPEATRQSVRVPAEGEASVRFALPQRRTWTPPRAGRSRERYR